VEALALGPERWDQLVARSAVPSPFMRWAWHHAWAESVPPHEADNSFVVALYGAAGSIEALVPLALRQMHFRRTRARVLGWAITDLGAPDHLDIPLIPGTSLDPVLALVEELPWDIMLLDRVTEGAAGVAELSRSLRRLGISVGWNATVACPYLELPADWDTYLASLSASRRQSIRRRERMLERQHTIAVTDYGPDRLEEGWRMLQRLHAQRWSGGGILKEPQLDRLLRRFTWDLAARDEVWLVTLDLDGEPAAAWYGFVWNDTVYFYQSGRDPRWESASVGLVLMAAMIRRAIERGYRRFDFLRGTEAYKRSWTSTERLNYTVTAFRRNWRGGLLRGLDLLARARENILERRNSGRDGDGSGNLDSKA
jgi:CelD/BcsL family acetyltransferase involved in cellulose biosynthesis